jgi:PAS domain S-box-containing protein
MGHPSMLGSEAARRRQMARFGALLFGGAAAVTALGLLLPHQPEVNAEGLAAVAAVTGLLAAVMGVGGERLPGWFYPLTPTFGTVLVSLALLFNGERSGGPAGGDEMYYLWVVLYSAYFLRGTTTAAQVALMAVAYAVTLAAIDPGPIAVSRWLSMIGLVVGSAIVVHVLSERVARLVERLRLVLDTAHEAFVSIDAEGLITAWNPEAEATFGWAHDEAVGHLLSDMIIPPEFRDAHREGIKRFFATGEGPVLGKRLELEALHRDGRRFPVELTISPVRVEGTYVFHAFLRDISERHQAQGYLAAQAAVSGALASSPELEEAMPSVLEALGECMGWRLGQFWIVDHESGVLRWRAAWHASGSTSDVFEAKSREMTFSPGVGLPGRVWSDGEPAWIEDVTKDPNFPRAQFAAQEGLHGAICVPLLSVGEVVGLIEFFSPQIREPDDDMIAMMGTISNQVGQFVERRRAEQEADRVKEEFFSLISHELRTPLAAIKGYLEFLLEGDGGELNEDGHRFLEVIGRKTGQLERIVGDLLFAARLESGNFMLDRTVVDLQGILEDCLEAAKPTVEQKQLALDVKSEPVGECVGDRDRLAQLFDNLISNAVKYTPAGGQIGVRLSRENGHVLVEVEDTGIGIPVRDQEHLFKRFFRASTAVKQRIPGVGLGLTIVKAIVDDHGGHVSVESKEGAGTKFSVELPLTRKTTQEATAKAKSGAVS